MATPVGISTLESRIKWAESMANYCELYRRENREVRDDTVKRQVELCHDFGESLRDYAWETPPPAGTIPTLEYVRSDGSTACLQFPDPPDADTPPETQPKRRATIVYIRNGRELTLDGMTSPTGPTMEDYLELIEDSGQPILDQLSNLQFQQVPSRQPARATQPAQSSPSPQPMPAFEPAIAT